MKFLALLLLGLTLPLQASLAEPSNAAAATLNHPSAPLILVVGDSLSAGYGMPIEKSWPVLLEQSLASASATNGAPAARIENISISGETSDGGLARLPDALTRFRPSLVFIALGGNDGLRGKSLKRLENNLDAMIIATHNAGAQAVLAGIHIPPNFGPRYTTGFHNIYAKLAERHNIVLLPFLLDGVATNAELMQSDGLHPTASAQTIIRDNVLNALLPVLRGETSQP